MGKFHLKRKQLRTKKQHQEFSIAKQCFFFFEICILCKCVCEITITSKCFDANTHLIIWTFKFSLTSVSFLWKHVSNVDNVFFFTRECCKQFYNNLGWKPLWLKIKWSNRFAMIFRLHFLVNLCFSTEAIYHFLSLFVAIRSKVLINIFMYWSTFKDVFVLILIINSLRLVIYSMSY